MTERRETGPTRKPARTNKSKKRNKPSEPDWSEGERIAKYLARCGVASRRACESLIEAGKVFVNGERLHSPAFKVTGREQIKVEGRIIRAPDATRLWRYHKPAGLLTTNSDPEGRATIFQELPKDLPRTVTIGRLDLNTEGLLLLTNDGELARALELPGNAFERTYRARAHGRITQDKLDTLKHGITVDGDVFGPITATLERQTGANSWLTVSLKEGKKREVRRALESLEMKVNRLIRVSYGPFELGKMTRGSVIEVPRHTLKEELGSLLPETNQPPSYAAGFERGSNRPHNRGNDKRRPRRNTKNRPPE
ncbi:MAG: pseudouridine synthase [Hyphomonadaceae bacterium]